jgi:hypothetical protein
VLIRWLADGGPGVAAMPAALGLHPARLPGTPPLNGRLGRISTHRSLLTRTPGLHGNPGDSEYGEPVQPPSTPATHDQRLVQQASRSRLLSAYSGSSVRAQQPSGRRSWKTCPARVGGPPSAGDAVAAPWPNPPGRTGRNGVVIRRRVPVF